MSVEEEDIAEDPSGSRNQSKHKVESSVSDGPHKLFKKLSFWFQDQEVSEDYEKCIQKIASFDTMEDFWKIYCHLKPPEDVASGNEFHVFLEGVKPLWEDQTNKYGGKWTIRVKREYGPPLWERLLMCYIGGQFRVPSDEVTGIVFGMKKSFHALSVWNRRWDHDEEKDIIRDTLVEKLQLPPGTQMDYKAHNKHYVEHQLKKLPVRTSEYYSRRGVNKGAVGQEYFTVRRNWEAEGQNDDTGDKSSPPRQPKNDERQKADRPKTDRQKKTRDKPEVGNAWARREKGNIYKEKKKQKERDKV